MQHILQLAALAAMARVGSASAILPRLPRETGIFEFPFDQITPIPTSAPEVPLELLRRADEKTTVLVAPDNVCGYISDRPGASFICPADFNCILFPPQSTFSGEVACCNPGSCNLRLTCLDFKQISSSSLCGDGCKVDAFTLKCTDTKSPFCNTASFPGNIFDYWCNDVEISTPQSADTTFKGQSNRGTFTPLVLGDSTTNGDLSFTLNTNDRESSTAEPTEANNDGDNNGNENSGGSGGGRKKKSNTGAIAGGVVGGVAAIGLIGAGAFLLFRKKHQQDKAANYVPPTSANTATTFPPTSPMPQNAYGPPGGVTPQNQSTYDPNYAQQMQQGQYGTPPSGVVYQQKPEYGGYYGQQQGMMAPPIDRNGSTSPMSDANRMSNITGAPLQSPTPSQTSNFTQQSYMTGQPHQQPQPYQQTQPTIHEAGSNQADHHRGQMHELA